MRPPHRCPPTGSSLGSQTADIPALHDTPVCSAHLDSRGGPATAPAVARPACDPSGVATSVCPGCGLRAEAGGIPLDRPLNASPECWGLHAELVGYELNHVALVGRCHQLTVDAYGAQHAGGPTGRRYVAYSLVGLCLALEDGRSGIDVRTAHQRMGPPMDWWPAFPRPHDTGRLTVADVIAAGARVDSVEGHADLVERWARDVWDAWGSQHADVRNLVRRLFG